ncbi:hypothetical protein DENIS_4755 [Desulfonema ishimotonii]|uniref:Phenylacetate--CoA ligase family protein n=1 Tax=Desulfonema ishimotonii TaxID=45657 RepID=A0A401G3D9_9BACT|nr:phenylacetate--CoA ligase family protein [Desulfonema ishimotonii]GBC63757.1 hypothetical protein DENIS_4755 [Desulfonema ishimotonii]
MKKNGYKFISAYFSLTLVDCIKKTKMLRTYRDLNKTQWLTKYHIEDIQIRRTKKILIHAFENVPYYRQLFKHRDFNPYRFQHFDDLRILPVLNKKKIRKNFNLLLAQNAHRFRPRRRQTSGSTAEPLLYYADELSHSCAWANNWRAFSMAGFQVGEPFVLLSGGSLMPRTTPTGQKIYAIMMRMKQLPAYQLDYAKTKFYIKLLQKYKCAYIFAYPSLIYLLSRYLIKMGKSHSVKFKAIFTTSEVLSHSQREIIQKAFDCPVYDTYGNNETSLYAFECECRQGLHYSMEHSYLEVLDSEGQPCNAGDTGRFIATNLFNYAMPFIRYDTGDLGALSEEECACQRGLKKIRHILGRSRDFVCTPDGKQIHGSFFNHVLFKLFHMNPWIATWHVRQEAINHITISLYSDGSPVRKDTEKIKDMLKKTLGHEMKIDFIIDKKPHITPTGKQKLIESCINEETIRINNSDK